MLIILLWLINPKALEFKVHDRFRITKCKNIFRKGYTESLSREILIIDSVMKNDPWIYKIKDLNGQKIMWIIMNCCGVIYSHIRQAVV